VAVGALDYRLYTEDVPWGVIKMPKNKYKRKKRGKDWSRYVYLYIFILPELIWGERTQTAASQISQSSSLEFIYIHMVFDYFVVHHQRF